MYKKRIHINNLSALRDFAQSFALRLRGGEIVGLVGELGAGKTAFVKEVALAMGVREKVKSPTFILLQVFFTGKKTMKSGIAQLCHVDAYRLDNYESLRTIGFLDYATDPGTVTFVEWADRVPEIHQLPMYRELTFSIEENDERTIIISA